MKQSTRNHNFWLRNKNQNLRGENKMKLEPKRT